MTADYDLPVFNLKAVVQETGLKPDTIRAWERRYGLPEPDRTSGGHRLYSRKEVDTLKWLMARQDEGLSISRAVDLWHALEADGQAPLQAMPFHSTTMAHHAGVVAGGEDVIAGMRAMWIEACQQFDEQRAETIVAEALGRYPAETVCYQMLQRGLSELGEQWYLGESTVQQEHFASEMAMRRVEALVAAAPLPTRPGKVLIGCPEGENHSFAALLVALTVKRLGWETIYLGGSVPIQHLRETVQQAKPRLIVMPAQQLLSAARLPAAAKVAEETRALFGFGGLIFNRVPALREYIPGYFLGESIASMGERVEQIMTSRPAPQAGIPPSRVYQIAAAYFEQRRVGIEARMWQLTQEDAALLRTHLFDANRFFAQGIQAALTLGDLHLLEGDIEWFREVMPIYDLPPDLLPHFLSLYREAAQDILDERGEIVLSWLDTILQAA
jgi:DNA-binding transcriptional MerR regulator